MAALTVADGPCRAPADARPSGPVPVRSAGPAAADRSGAGARADRAVRSWPLLVLAVPAAAEVWSGWVGIAQKTGFGLVRPLPGIWPVAAPGHRHHAPDRRRGVRGVRAAGLAGPRPGDQRTDAPVRQVVGDLLVALGMAGQVAYHLMAQAGTTRAPWAITTVVSCLPVLVLAMGTALAHMLRADAETTNAPDNGTRPPAALRSLPWSPDDRDRPDRVRPETDRDRSPAGTRTAETPGRQRGRGGAGPVSGPPGRRWIRHALSPAGLPRRGSPYRGERCAAAESRARTRR